MPRPQALLITPLHPCHDCHTLAPVVPLNNGAFRCSCSTVRWTGITTAQGPRAIGLRAGNGAAMCWRCVEATTPPGQFIPNVPYMCGGVSNIMSDDSSYKEDAWCDECGNKITAQH